ncbi:MAG: 6-oxopurine nucleoside phosphorylase [Archaeoglobus sp.]|nr:MAG: 6-oxopurine nucleoside phosphorylase [Archaeoglobus sp.]
MPDVAVVGGTNILNYEVLENVRVVKAKTPFGKTELEVGEVEGIEVVLLRRHGRRNNIPPHRINHPANFYALKELGVKSAIGMGSVGCLRKDIKLPAIAIPHDYIDFFSNVTTVKNELFHITPEFDEELRKILINEARKVCSKNEYSLLERAVYFQSRGPRLETKAEVAVISRWADCVGMTAGSEATVAKELGIAYAAICTVDNYAHGIRGETVDYREIVKKAGESARVCLEIVFNSVRRLLERG